MDIEVENGSAPPFLGIDQLFRLGKDCGFNDKDESELLVDANSGTNGV
jgi:hypothetical protein